MNKITLRPLLKFIASQKRLHFTPGDLAQLIASRRRQAWPAGSPAAVREKLYLEVLTAADFFQGRKKISSEELIDAVNKIMVENNFGYQRSRHHAARPKNSFYTDHSARRGVKELYDLAFCHPAARQDRRAHHSHNDQPAVFYVRCELVGNKILFGNLQIDARAPGDWQNKALAQEVRRPKNIYNMMVQQAVKHALETGQKEILFQAGDAVEIAQWQKTYFCRIKVTEKNYAKINKIYEQELARFRAPLGTVICRPEFNRIPEVIVKSSSGMYITHRKVPIAPNLLTEIRWLETTRAPDGRSVSKVVQQGIRECVAAVKRSQPAAVPARLEQLITELTGTTTPAAAQVAHCAELQAVLKKKKLNPAWWSRDDFGKMIEKYLVRWGYDKILLRKFPVLKRVDLQGARAKGFGAYIYHYVRGQHGKLTYQQARCRPPEIGKSYLVNRKNKHNINFKEIIDSACHGHIHDWYETALPAELKRLGLGCKKIKIRTQKGTTHHQAHAWKIVSGVEEFAQRPLVLF